MTGESDPPEEPHGAQETQNPPRLRTARSRALSAMAAASVLFAVMGVFTKLAARPAPDLPRLSGGEIALFRYLFGLAFLLPVGAVLRVPLLGYDRAGLLTRGVLGGVASTSLFLALELTSLTNATLLNYTSVIWGPLIATFALSERLDRRGVLAVAAALVGVVLVLKPASLFTSGAHLGDLVGVVSGLTAGASIVQVRRLRQGESAFAIFFYFNLIGLPVALLTTALFRTPLVWPAPAQWPLLLGVGASSVGGQLCVTYGYKELTTAQGSLIMLLTVVYAAVFAALVFHDAPGWHTAAGGALILSGAASLTLARRER